MSKPGVWINIIFLIILTIVLILIFTGCAREEQWRNGDRTFAHKGQDGQR